MRRLAHQLISGRGANPVPRSLLQRCEGAGLQGRMGPIYVAAYCSHVVVPVTHPTLESVRFRSSPGGDPHFIFRMAPSGTRPVSR